MAKEITIHVQKLNEGFVLTKENKTRALTIIDDVNRSIIFELKQLLNVLSTVNTNDILVTIRVDTNLPKST